MLKNLDNSLSVFLPQPYTMLVGTETAERRNFEVNPQSSSLGKDFVKL